MEGQKIELIEPPYVSVQGEGCNIGRPTLFVRTAGCPVQCTWCDSKYSWGKGEFQLTEDDLDHLIESATSKVVWFTGGEPLVWRNWLLSWLKRFKTNLRDHGDFELQICTSGIYNDEPTRLLLSQLGWVTIDIKLSSAHTKLQTDMSLVDWLYQQKPLSSELKMVLSDNKDLMKACELAKKYPKFEVILQPKYVVHVVREGRATYVDYPYLLTSDRIISQEPEPGYTGWAYTLSGIAHEFPNIRFLPQFHKIIWPNIVKGV